MRPRGEVRQALGNAAELIGPRGGSFREYAQQACVGFDAARQTLRDMARAGELAVVGTARVPGVCRPVVCYATPAMPSPTAGADLACVFASWANFD